MPARQPALRGRDHRSRLVVLASHLLGYGCFNRGLAGRGQALLHPDLAALPGLKQS